MKMSHQKKIQKVKKSFNQPKRDKKFQTYHKKRKRSPRKKNQLVRRITRKKRTIPVKRTISKETTKVKPNETFKFMRFEDIPRTEADFKKKEKGTPGV